MTYLTILIRQESIKSSLHYFIILKVLEAGLETFCGKKFLNP